MASTFSYKARDTSTGKVVRGTISGPSEAAAGRALIAQGLIPLGELRDNGEGGIMQLFTGHVASKNLVIFTRQLATMLNAGLPLAQSLAMAGEQSSDKQLKSIIADVVNNVNGGAPLSDSLAKYPDVFNNVYIAIVRAGETSGTMDKSLERLADQQEHDADQRSKILGAMIYPAIVLVVIIAVVIFMVVSLIPQVVSMYNDLGKTLPATTQFLMNIVNFFSKFWFIILAALIAIGFFTAQWHKTENGKRSSDRFKLNVPGFSTLFRKLYMARFARTAQVLLESGVSMIETLKISADAVNNLEVRDEILQAVGKVRNGKALSDALSGQDYILPFVPQMIRIGESSGSIDTLLGKVADYYDKEVDNAIAAINTLIEPVLMVLMAFMIGFIVLAVLLPIYGLTDTSTI